MQKLIGTKVQKSKNRQKTKSNKSINPDKKWVVGKKKYYQPFSSQCSLSIPWKNQKTKGFLMFSGGSKRNIGRRRVKKGLLNLPNSRSSHLRCFIIQAVLKNFAIFAGKLLCWSPFFNQIAGFRQCFPVTIAKFLRTAILKNICKQLLLETNDRVKK